MMIGDAQYGHLSGNKIDPLRLLGRVFHTQIEGACKAGLIAYSGDDEGQLDIGHFLSEV
jgi:hypothetical protein